MSELIPQLSEQELAAIDAELAHVPYRSAAAIDALKIVQEHRGWVSDESLRAIARHLFLKLLRRKRLEPPAMDLASAGDLKEKQEVPKRPSAQDIFKDPALGLAWMNSAAAVQKNNAGDPMFVVKASKA